MWIFASRSLYKVSTCVGYMLFESTVELRGGNLLYVSRTEGSGFDGPQVSGTGHLAVTVFSDESRFNLSFDDGKIRCWRPIGEAYVPQVLALRSSSTTIVMVHGCISVHGTGEFVVLEGNINH